MKYFVTLETREGVRDLVCLHYNVSGGMPQEAMDKIRDDYVKKFPMALLKRIDVFGDISEWRKGNSLYTWHSC